MALLGGVGGSVSFVGASSSVAAKWSMTMRLWKQEWVRGFFDAADSRSGEFRSQVSALLERQVNPRVSSVQRGQRVHENRAAYGLDTQTTLIDGSP